MPSVSVELFFFSILRQFYYQPLLFFWFFIHPDIVLPTCSYSGRYIFWISSQHALGGSQGNTLKLESGPSQRLRFDARSVIWGGIPPLRFGDGVSLHFPPREDGIVQTADASFPTLPRYAAPCCPSCSAAWPAALSWHQLASLKWHQVLCQLCVSGANLRFPK